MKMETQVFAHRAGTIARLGSEADYVKAGTALARIEA